MRACVRACVYVCVCVTLEPLQKPAPHNTFRREHKSPKEAQKRARKGPARGGQTAQLKCRMAKLNSRTLPTNNPWRIAVRVEWGVGWEGAGVEKRRERMVI